MGEEQLYQPLTKEDKVTVILYRIGIFLSTAIIGLVAMLAVRSIPGDETPVYPLAVSGTVSIVLLLLLYASVGISVFFIHLYVGKFYRMLKKTYYLALICLAVLFFVGHGNPVLPLFRVPPYGAMLMVPLSLCLGFVAAKEAFCFRLVEGYLLAIFLPASVFFYSLGAFDQKTAAFLLAFIAVMLVFFTLRKVFMPIHYDIGDKSAYQP